jgi:phosphate transport system permease protein
MVDSERLLTAAVWLAVMMVSGLCAWILGDLLWHGAPQLSWSFLIEAPRSAGKLGGIGPILVSTGLILLVCLAVAVPLGLGTAVLLSELTPAGSPLGRLVRRGLDVLAGVPSILFGLFGNALFCIYLGLGFSILAGGLTLACMVLPILVRATEEGLRSVPSDYRLAAAALGMSQARTLLRVVLPAGTPGLVVGLVLGIGRALAETAALIFTSGYVDRMPRSLLDSGRALSVHIYDLAMNIAGGEPHAYASALVLVGSLLAINGLAGWCSGRWLGRKVVVA